MFAWRPPVRETTLFLVVGGVTFLLFYGLFEALQRSLSEDAALTIAYLLAVSVNFAANRAVTFQQNGQRPLAILHSMGRFGVLAAVNYIVSIGLTLSAIKAGATDLFAVALGILATTCVSFLLSKYWVFRSGPTRQ